jgi:hypothetical protein
MLATSVGPYMRENEDTPERKCRFPAFHCSDCSVCCCGCHECTLCPTTSLLNDAGSKTSLLYAQTLLVVLLLRGASVIRLECCSVRQPLQVLPFEACALPDSAGLDGLCWRIANLCILPHWGVIWRAHHSYTHT